MSDMAADLKRSRFWTPGFVLLMLGALAALVVLLALGTWQVQRLAWKEDLIATIEARRAGEPRTADALLAEYDLAGDVEYMPVRLRGVFAPEEVYAHATMRGEAGWHVLAPLYLPDGRVAVVNRGFVPDGLRAPATRPESAPPREPVEVVGLARNPQFEKPNGFVPDNDLPDRLFYWKDFDALRLLLGLPEDRALPFLIDVAETPDGVLPRGGTTVISLPNNHLGYAVTWFGIAAALVGVVGSLVVQRRKARRAA